MDIHWKSALTATLDVLPFVDVVYAPDAFFKYSRKFYPYEISLYQSDKKIAFCIQKDSFHKLSPELLETIINPEQVFFSNDVFIVCCVNPPPSIQWHYYKDARFEEFNQIKQQAIGNASDKNMTPYWKTVNSKGNKRILVVGASNMGNTGDDLLAYALEKIIIESNPDFSLSFSDSRITKSDLKDFDCVVVGGGGIIYASQFNTNETQNLVNYLKIPVWAKEFGIP